MNHKGEITIDVDELTYNRIRLLASELLLSQQEVVKRAIGILAMARVVAKGHEVDERNRRE